MSSESTVSLPDPLETQRERRNWGEERTRAWQTFYDARPGDKVVWADRSIGMTVAETRVDSQGNRVVEVEKPRADGTYRLREKWDENRPRITSDIGRANNLRFTERGESDRSRELTAAEYDDLVERLVENAVDSFLRHDYEDWSRAVADVVEDWSERVALRQWQGYTHHPDWQDGDPDTIFRSVVKHSTDGDFADDADLTTREQAELVVHDAVLASGRERAEETIVTDAEDYRDLVEKLAHHTLDRIDRKSYADARVATRDTISDWVDDRREPAYHAIIEYGYAQFDEAEYEHYEGEEMYREMAFDILNLDVWEEVQHLQRDRGQHDPTLRGLTREQYWELVDHLVGRTLRQWDDGFLRTTARDVVQNWADRVANEQWAEHRHRIWADGDVEDIFASATIHAETNPFVWNPFAADKERRMAEQAILADVVDQAEDTYDETQPETEPVPANEYMEDVLGVDVTYDDLKEAEPQEVNKTLSRITEAMNGDEVGWTFVDEIIEMGGTVPETTNDWVLVDYGVIREGDQLRKLAWFNRGTGDVLVLSGMANGTPEQLTDLADPYDQFHVTFHEYQASEPEFVCESVSLEAGLECVLDYVDETKADIRIIETRDGDFVQEQITEEDINTGGVIDSLVPNLPIGSEDILTAADNRARGVAGFVTRDWLPELAAITAYTAISVAPRWVGERLDGVRVEPSISKRHGVGTKVSKNFGKAPHESGIGGRAQVELNVRPETFSTLGERYAPQILRRGFEEGDLGKGAVREVGEGIEGLRTWGQWYNDATIPEIQQTDLDSLGLEELQALADRTDRGYADDDYTDADKLRKKLWGYANHAEPQSFGQAFLDEFGDSAMSFFDVLSEGVEDAQEERLKREFLADFHDIPEEEVDVEAMWDEDEIAPEVLQGYYEDVIEEANFSWDEFERQDLGISGLLMRGLDAESLVKGAEFFDVDDWLEENFTFVGGDYWEGEEQPTFAEWKAERYGPGQPAGPEEEARQMARFHKEVAAADVEAADPFESLGIDPEMVERQGDYEQAQYQFDGEFGNDFDNVAERLDAQESEMAAQEFERSLDAVDES